jgi:hypothetical protein
MLFKGWAYHLVWDTVERVRDVKLDGDYPLRPLRLAQEFIKDMKVIEAARFIYKTLLPGGEGGVFPESLIDNTPKHLVQESSDCDRPIVLHFGAILAWFWE